VDGLGDSALSSQEASNLYTAGVDSAGIVPVETVKVTDPASNTLTYEFDPENGYREIASTDARGYTTTYGYDTAGFLNTTTDANGNVTVADHDARGNEVSETTCQDTATQACSTQYWTYYPANNTTAVLTTASPENDQVLTYRDARSSSSSDATYETQYAYNNCGEKTGETTPPVAGYASGRTTTTVYTTGSSSTTCGAAALAYGSSSSYAPAGLVASVTTPGGAVTSYTYYADGDLATETTPLGAVTTYTYDGLGRVAGKTVSWSATYAGTSTGASAVTSYTYTGDGQVATETDPATTDAVTGYTHQQVTTFTYTLDGLVAKTVASDEGTGADTSRTTVDAYNGDDELESVTDPAGGVTSYTYDAFGRKVSVTDPDGNVTDYAYDADGNLATTTLVGYTGNPAGPTTAANLVLESRAYDPADRLASVTDSMGRTTSYTYLDNGLTATVTVSQNGSSFVEKSDTYDATGNLTAQVTDNGATTTQWTYDAAARKLTETQDPGGVDRVTAYTYTADDDVATQAITADATTLTTTSTYDAAGDALTTTLTGDGTTRTITDTYDTRGLLLTSQNADAQTTTFSYDALGQKTETLAPAVTATVFSTSTLTASTASANPTTLTGFNTFGEQAETQDADGNVTTQYFDGDGRVTEIKGAPYTPYGASTAITPVETKTYDADGNLLTDVSPLSETTSYVYDQLGDVAEVKDPLGAVTYNTYDTDGELLSSTSPAGVVTAQTFDFLGRKATSSVYESALSETLTTTYSYGTGGWLSQQASPAGVTATYTYDDLGEKLTATDGAGNVTAYTYDGFGHVAKTVMADGTYTEDAYNALGATTSNAAYTSAGTKLASSSATYDADGNVLTATNPLGAVESFAYDADGDLVQETQPVTASSSYSIALGYDLAGNETAYTDGNGDSTYYTWNSLGLKDTKTVPATTAYSGQTGQVTSYLYNADGELTGEDLPGSVTQTMTYDADGNLLTQSGTTPADTEASATTLARVFAYNGDSELTQAQTCTDASCGSGTVDSSENYTYNSEGELATATSTTDPANTSSFTYTDDGLMATRTDASGTSYYTYDTADRLATDQDAASGQKLTYTYNNMDQLDLITYSGGDTRTFGYDPLGRLTSDEVENSGSARVGEIDYGYNAASELTSMNDYGIGTTSANTEATNSYTYDEAGELTSWTATPAGGNAKTVTYGYDDAGNRTSVDGTTYTYDQRDELTSNGTNTYTYTADGTLATSTVTVTDLEGTYTSDAYGQQITAGSTTYTYDALGRALTSGATTLAYSGQDNTVASDGTTTYSRDPDGTITGVDSTTLGASTAWTDQHTNMVATFASGASGLTSWTVYDPLGNVTASSGAQTSVGYQSEYTDPATGQVNMDARWYSPSEGQFTSADTVNNNPVPDPDAANPYTYATDAPTMATDPSGHDAPCADACPVGMVGGTEAGGGGGGDAGGGDGSSASTGDAGFAEAGDADTSDDSNDNQSADTSDDSNDFDDNGDDFGRREGEARYEQEQDEQNRQNTDSSDDNSDSSRSNSSRSAQSTLTEDEAEQNSRMGRVTVRDAGDQRVGLNPDTGGTTVATASRVAVQPDERAPLCQSFMRRPVVG
jgi:RHS repeat-associated protein